MKDQGYFKLFFLLLGFLDNFPSDIKKRWRGKTLGNIGFQEIIFSGVDWDIVGKN